MAGITDLPYRRVMKAFGAALVFSEMVSANGVVRNGTRSLELVNSSADERPLAIQIFGDDPQQLADTAKLLEERAELIDINCGCPVNKVIRSGAGSALMREPARIGKIVATVRKAVSVPLTIKIRAGWDHATLNYLEVARIAATEGADAITLHPRTTGYAPVKPSSSAVIRASLRPARTCTSNSGTTAWPRIRATTSSASEGLFGTMIYYVSRLRLVWGCARLFSARRSPLARPVAPLRASQVVHRWAKNLSCSPTNGLTKQSLGTVGDLSPHLLPNPVADHLQGPW
jgi:hypothetical protein